MVAVLSLLVGGQVAHRLYFSVLGQLTGGQVAAPAFPHVVNHYQLFFLSHDFHHELFEEYKKVGRSFRQMKITSTTKFLKTGNLTTSQQAAKLAQGDHGENWGDHWGGQKSYNTQRLRHSCGGEY